MSVTPASRSFGTTENTNPPPATLTIANTGGLPILYVIETTASWLSVSKTSGGIGFGESPSIQVSVNAAGLAPSIYSGSIRVSDAGGAVPAVTISVSLTVTPGTTLTFPGTWQGNFGNPDLIVNVIEFTGTLSGNRITGTLTVPNGGGNGNFNITKQ